MDNAPQQQPQQSAPTGNVPQTKGHTDNRTIMGVLAYLGILVIIPYVAEKNDPFVKFHTKQGFVLATIEIATWVIGMAIWQLAVLLSLVNIATLILSIVGIVNVVHGKQEKLPLVGDFSRYFTF
jgi:uncharacterized membrane protein